MKIFKEDDTVMIEPIEETSLEVRDIIKINEIIKSFCNNEKQLVLTHIKKKYIDTFEDPYPPHYLDSLI
ncbi:MAG: hypothetical protein JKY54_12565, partial [Flavobacteriales bacterium]|nr:hypothetical protein [Flavobacteriales bacterium]